MKWKLRLKQLWTQKRFIEEGCCLPRGWGVAYREWLRAVAVVYPIPLNFIVGYFHDVIMVLLYRGLLPSHFERRLRAEILRSEKRGWMIGYAKGFDKGHKAGCKNTRAQITRAQNEAGIRVFGKETWQQIIGPIV